MLEVAGYLFFGILFGFLAQYMKDFFSREARIMNNLSTLFFQSVAVDFFCVLFVHSLNSMLSAVEARTVSCPAVSWPHLKQTAMLIFNAHHLLWSRVGVLGCYQELKSHCRESLLLIQYLQMPYSEITEVLKTIWISDGKYLNRQMLLSSYLLSVQLWKYPQEAT